MNVASLKLCKELYELSGWKPEDRYWMADHAEKTTATFVSSEGKTPNTPVWYTEEAPAYDLGYLLRKLPYKVKDEYQYDQFGVHLKQTGGGGWTAYYGEPGKPSEMYFNTSEKLEDCVAKLAIELLKQGVLPSESSTAKPQASPKGASNV